MHTSTLTEKQRELLLEALLLSRAFKRYGEGREEHQAAVDEVIDKLGLELLTSSLP